MHADAADSKASQHLPRRLRSTHTAGFHGRPFALLFLVPDLSMLAYLAGPTGGRLNYNLAHTYAFALAPCLPDLRRSGSAAMAGGLIWIAHIGLDRALGYGLKYPTGFGDTHLGRR